MDIYTLSIKKRNKSSEKVIQDDFARGLNFIQSKDLKTQSAAVTVKLTADATIFLELYR